MTGKLRVIDGNILFLVGALIYFFIGLFIPFEDVRISLMSIQLFVVLLPPIIYLKSKGVKIKEALRLNKLRVKHGFMIGVITLLLYPVAMLGNILLLIFFSLFGELQPPQIPTPHNIGEYFVLILIVSIVAGICEEVFFRGFMLSAYERIGKTKAIIITSILFGVFHFNLYNLFGPMILGLVFGYLVFLTDSIYAGIIGHIVNNGFAMTLAFLLNMVTENLPIDEVPIEPELSITMSLMMTFVFLTVVSVVTGFIAYVIVERIRKDLKKDSIKEDHEDLRVASDNSEGFLNSLDSDDYKTKSSEFFPLLFIVPLYMFIVVIQIRQLLGVL